MSKICATVAADVTIDCSNKPVMGIEQNVLIFPSQTLQYSGITFDGTNPNELITGITAASGGGFVFEGLLAKDQVNAIVDSVIDNASLDGFTHRIEGIKIMNASVAIQKQLNSLITGGDLFRAIINLRWKGASSANAFRMFGVNVLMKAEYAYNANENDGAPIINLFTKDGHKEPYAPHQVLLTDNPTTLAAFNNKFAPA